MYRNHPSFVSLYKYVFVYYKGEHGSEKDLETGKISSLIIVKFIRIVEKLKKVAAELRKQEPKIFVAEIDVSKNQSEDPNDPGVLQILGIKSTPHFKLYISMSVSFDYKRTFEVAELIKWVKGKILLTSSEIKDINEFQIYHEEKRPLVGKDLTSNLSI